MNYWLVASYKINELARLKSNLINQNFNYYLPKIFTLDSNAKQKEEILFPGYVFVNTNMSKYSKLKFTRGIKNVIKFGNNISCLTNKEVNGIKMIEDATNVIGDVQSISPGPNSRAIHEICSADVALFAAIAYFAPVTDIKDFSKSGTFGPCVKKSERRTSTTESISC